MRRVAAIGAFLLLATACGGTRDSSAEETAADAPAPSRAEYIAEADALCASLTAEHPEVAKSAEELQKMSPSDPAFREKAVAHFKRVLKVAESSLHEFRAVEPPAADRERIEEFNDANEEAIQRLRELIDAFESGGDVDQAGQAYVEALGKADRLAEAYGFEVCARLPEDS